MSLVLVGVGTPGFTRDGPLRKIGLPAQDTAELTSDDVRVPRSHLLGAANEGFDHLRHNLPQERLGVAVTSRAAVRRTSGQALRHSCDRQAFGRRITGFPANRFYPSNSPPRSRSPRPSSTAAFSTAPPQPWTVSPPRGPSGG